MAPGKNVGQWLLRFFCFFVIFSASILAELGHDFMMFDRFSSAFGYISAPRWDDLVVGVCAFISVLLTSLVTLIVSGKSEASRWLVQIVVYLVLFAAIYTALPEQYVSFILIAGGALVLTSLLVFVAAKQPNKQCK
ncbi:hypothetical protein O7047_17265 [Pseudenterobacter timonensis]|uniref:Uncharacterized protein n=1 Tax=Pseudenterobacter timonensis TaxID=1755099 RepID=A0AAE4IW26_9ENTR|nr:hypothetical protein [Pseudenterobacter timonensis]MDR9891970.1 hypothetical protein [Pseudenterobacter timonensis]